MDFAERMTALLSELRRERNGAAADAMRFCGRPCGLNLGVVIPTIRTVAASVARDHAFARYLYKQDVRELRIAAVWIAEPERVGPAELDFWCAGIINSELAEQAAMALLSRVGCVDALLESWPSKGELAAYAALMSAARNDAASVCTVLKAVNESLERYPDSRIVGHGAVAAVMAAYRREPDKVKAFAAGLKPATSAAQYVCGELSWQME